jgi:hypothetical protein
VVGVLEAGMEEVEFWRLLGRFDDVILKKVLGGKTSPIY